MYKEEAIELTRIGDEAICNVCGSVTKGKITFISSRGINISESAFENSTFIKWQNVKSIIRKHKILIHQKEFVDELIFGSDTADLSLIIDKKTFYKNDNGIKFNFKMTEKEFDELGFDGLSASIDKALLEIRKQIITEFKKTFITNQ